MRFIECFAGIGGWSYGLSKAGMICVGHIERDKFAQSILHKHYPEVPLVSNIEDVTGEEFGTINLVCGSPPCQPFSSATHGRRKGKADNRYLWPAMCNVIQLYRPSWVACENVAGFAKMAGQEIISDLEALGFEVGEPLGIPACAVGKDHIRKRAWVFGYSDSNRKSRLSLDAEAPRMQGTRSDTGSLGTENGVSKRVHRPRLRALGNSLVPEIPEIIGACILEIERKLTLQIPSI